MAQSTPEKPAPHKAPRKAQPKGSQRAPRKRAKQSSPQLSTLAARILSGKHTPTAEEIKRLAASVLSQDMVRGQREPKKASEQAEGAAS